MWVPLRFAFWTVAKLMCSCLCLFDAIIELHVMDESIFNEFLIRKRMWILHVIYAYLINDLCEYVVRAFIKLN